MRIPGESLALRLTIVGGLQVLTLIIVVSLSVPVSYYLQDRESPQGVAREVKRAVDTAVPLQPVLDELGKDKHFDLSVYDVSGELVASNVSPALPLRPEISFRALPFPPGGPRGPGPMGIGHGPPPPPPGFVAPLLPALMGDDRPPHGPPVMVMPLRSGDATYSLVMRLPKHSYSFVPLLITLVVGALVVTLGAVLTSRFITLPLERLSKVVGAFGAGQFTSRSDIDRRDEVGILATTFNQMADRIQNMRESERELLNNVAHELRTPLARIGVALEIAEESDGSGTKVALLGIREDLSELEGLLEDVLTASRLQSASGSERWVLRPETLSLQSVVLALQSRFNAHHPDRTLRVECNASDAAIAADAVLLRRAVSNLLENAHKYSPDPASPIWLRVVVEQEHCTFSVEDRGMGISASDQEKVFLPFYRSEQSRSKSTGGVGLGLTLAKRIAEAHGGSVQLESTPGFGTVVRLTLPMMASESQTSQQFDIHQ